MNKKRFRILTILVLILLGITFTTALAAPIGGAGFEHLILLSEEASVNLPGWVGGLLTIIALILPLAFRVWIRQNRA